MKFLVLTAIAAIAAPAFAADCQISDLLGFANQAMLCGKVANMDFMKIPTLPPAEAAKLCVYPECSKLYNDIGNSGLTCTIQGRPVTHLKTFCAAATTVPVTTKPVTTSPATTAPVTTAPTPTTAPVIC